MSSCPPLRQRAVWLRGLLLFLILASPACSSDSGPAPQGETTATAKPSRTEQKRFEDLTIKLAMQGPGIVGTAPSQVRWSADASQVYLYWNPPQKLDSLNAEEPQAAYEHYLAVEDDAATWAYDVATGTLTRLSDAEADETVPDEASWDTRRARCAQIRGNDVYLVDVVTGKTRRITATLERESGVTISPSGDAVYFSRGGNLFSLPWEGAPIRQLTDIRADDEPKDKALSDQRSYLVDQQKELFAEFRREKKKKEPRIKPVYVGKGWDIDRIIASPSGRYAALEISSDADGARKPVIPHFVTESGYMTTTETRPKVGDLRGSTQIRIVDLRGDSLLTLKTDDTMWMSARSWSPVDDVLLARGIDARYKKRIFYGVNPGDVDPEGKVNLRILDEYDDAAWVGGPGFYRTGAWLRDGSGIYFLSEARGYSHLYTVSLDGSKREELTGGRWEVYQARQSIDGGRWYLVTNEDDPGTRRLWVMNRDGSDRHPLVEGGGGCRPFYAPNDAYVACLRSTVADPPELYLLDLEDEQWSEPITRSTTELFRSFAWIRPDVVTIKASDGGHFRAQIFRPKDFGRPANRAGVIFIHGAGYLQNVADYWSYYYREYMFNHYLAVHGYTVMNVDFRGSAGYGRESRVAIHKHMGGRDLDDIIDAAHYMVRNEGVDEQRVGVYGGSYGGFLTIMALFKYPDVIHAGGAIRSVTDWAHYNHWYTVRILGTPTEDPDAYRRSSPIYFADGFKGGLLMLHGLVDSNVLAQDVLRLSQVLIDLGKEDWDLMVYPLEDHAFERASSWTDEYRRIYKLFEEKLAE